MSRRSNQKKHGLPRGNQEAELRSWCDDRGVELRITNERQHWQFCRGPSTINWWPSTGRLRDAADKNYFRVLLGDIGGFLASDFPPPEEPPFEVVDKEDDSPPLDPQTSDEQNMWDYFAQAALQGVASRPTRKSLRPTEAALYCALTADAMMAERANRKAGP